MTTCRCVSSDPVSSRGSGPIADFMVRQSNRFHEEWQRNAYVFARMTPVFDALRVVFEDSSRPEWDGYSAKAVSGDTFLMARKVLAALPWGTPLPSIGAEPDGHITLEWFRSPHQTLSVSVSPDGDLHYAALLGASAQFGTESFYDVMPEVILDLVNRIAAA